MKTKYENSIRNNEELLVKIQLMESALQAMTLHKSESSSSNCATAAEILVSEISQSPCDSCGSVLKYVAEERSDVLKSSEESAGNTSSRAAVRRKRVVNSLSTVQSLGECQLLRQFEQHTIKSFIPVANKCTEKNPCRLLKSKLSIERSVNIIDHADILVLDLLTHPRQ